MSSDNEYYRQSVTNYNFNPKVYLIALYDTENNIAQAIVNGEALGTNNWDSLRRPRIERGIARLNQANSGIDYSVVRLLKRRFKGALLYNYFQDYDGIGKQQDTFMRHYTKLVGDILATRELA